MSDGSNYVKAIESIKGEMKRLGDRQRILREERKKTEFRLFQWMRARGYQDFEGYKLEKLKPKEMVPVLRKKKKEKVADAINLFRDIGVSDPVGLYQEFLATQKNVPVEE